MKRIPRIYDPVLNDISQFERLDYKCKQDLLSYSFNSLKAIDDSINKCDNKTALQIPFLLALYAGYGTWVKDYFSDYYVKMFFNVNTIFLIVLLLLCFYSLLVIIIETPPPISNIIVWLKKENAEKIEDRLLSTILFKFAKAEYLNYQSMKRKTNLLKITQLLIMFYILSILFNLLINL